MKEPAYFCVGEIHAHCEGKKHKLLVDMSLDGDNEIITSFSGSEMTSCYTLRYLTEICEQQVEIIAICFDKYFVSKRDLKKLIDLAPAVREAWMLVSNKMNEIKI